MRRGRSTTCSIGVTVVRTCSSKRMTTMRFFASSPKAITVTPRRGGRGIFTKRDSRVFQFKMTPIFTPCAVMWNGIRYVQNKSVQQSSGNTVHYFAGTNPVNRSQRYWCHGRFVACQIGTIALTHHGRNPSWMRYALRSRGDGLTAATSGSKKSLSSTRYGQRSVLSGVQENGSQQRKIEPPSDKLPPSHLLRPTAREQ